MTEMEKAAVMERATAMAREQFGAQATFDPEHGIVAIPVLGHPFPVIVFANRCGPWALLEAGVAIAEAIDWSMEGLAEFLLAENQKLFFGRIQRADDGLVMSHLVFADTPAAQFGVVIQAMAATTMHLASELQRLGALTVIEEEAEE